MQQVKAQGQERMSLTIDEILGRVGGHGRFQTMLMLGISYIFLSMVAFHLMIIAFTAAEPYWECVENSTVCNLTETVSTVSEHYMERCDMPRSEWKFTNSYTSIVTEYELVCEDSILQSVTSSLFWVGWFVGNIVMGYVSDKFGRKKANQVSVCLVFFSSWILVWPKQLWLYMTCRFISGFGNGGACMCCFIILMEYTQSKRRAIVGSLLWITAPFTYTSIALLAYLIREWRDLMLVGAILGTPVMIFVWFIPETPRQLLVHGKHDEARAVLEKVAKCNKKEMPQDEIFVPKQADDERANFRDLFYNKSISSITLVTWFLWFTVSLIYYAVSYNVVYLGGNIYISFFFNNVILLPANGISVVAMKRIGRKKTVIIGLLFATICTVITVSIPPDRSNTGFSAGRIIAAMFAKGSIYASFVVIYVLGAELFPTTVRNIAMGTSSACARIGSFIALYIIWLQRIHRYAPYVILALLSLLSGILCHIFIPETKGKQTAEVLGAESEKDENLNHPPVQAYENEVEIK